MYHYTSIGGQIDILRHYRVKFVDDLRFGNGVHYNGKKIANVICDEKYGNFPLFVSLDNSEGLNIPNEYEQRKMAKTFLCSYYSNCKYERPKEYSFSLEQMSKNMFYPCGTIEVKETFSKNKKFFDLYFDLQKYAIKVIGENGFEGDINLFGTLKDPYEIEARERARTWMFAIS